MPAMLMRILGPFSRR